jgi:hypothetical protein
MRTVRLALCLVGLTTLYPAVSHAAEICYSAYVPAASPQWRSGCDGEIAGTTGHSWGVTLYAIDSPDPSIGGGDICYDVYTPHGWFSQCDGTPIGYGSDGIQQLRVSYYTGPATLQYRAHVGGVGWEEIVNYNQVVGEVGHGVEALEVNIHLSGETEFWQQS